MNIITDSDFRKQMKCSEWQKKNNSSPKYSQDNIWIIWTSVKFKFSMRDISDTNQALLVQSSAVLDSRVYTSNCNWTRLRLYHYCDRKQNRNAGLYLHGNLPEVFREVRNPSCPCKAAWTSCELPTAVCTCWWTLLLHRPLGGWSLHSKPHVGGGGDAAIVVDKEDG